MNSAQQDVLARAIKCQQEGGHLSREDLTILLEMANQEVLDSKVRNLLVLYIGLLEAWWDKTSALGAEESHDLRNILQVLFACREQLRGSPLRRSGEQ